MSNNLSAKAELNHSLEALLSALPSSETLVLSMEPLSRTSTSIQYDDRGDSVIAFYPNMEDEVFAALGDFRTSSDGGRTATLRIISDTGALTLIADRTPGVPAQDQCDVILTGPVRLAFSGRPNLNNFTPEEVQLILDDFSQYTNQVLLCRTAGESVEVTETMRGRDYNISDVLTPLVEAVNQLL